MMDEQTCWLMDGYIICIFLNNLQRISLGFCIFESCQVSYAECAVKLYILHFKCQITPYYLSIILRSIFRLSSFYIGCVNRW